jgi:parallel beta-helix repeat protein
MFKGLKVASLPLQSVIRKVAKPLVLTVVLILSGFFVANNVVLAAHTPTTTAIPNVVDINQVIPSLTFGVTSIGDPLIAVQINYVNTGFSDPVSVICPDIWDLTIDPILKTIRCQAPYGSSQQIVNVSINTIAPNISGEKTFQLVSADTKGYLNPVNSSVTVRAKSLSATGIITPQTTIGGEDRNYTLSVTNSGEDEITEIKGVLTNFTINECRVDGWSCVKGENGEFTISGGSLISNGILEIPINATTSISAGSQPISASAKGTAGGTATVLMNPAAITVLTPANLAIGDITANTLFISKNGISSATVTAIVSNSGSSKANLTVKSLSITDAMDSPITGLTITETASAINEVVDGSPVTLSWAVVADSSLGFEGAVKAKIDLQYTDANVDNPPAISITKNQESIFTIDNIAPEFSSITANPSLAKAGDSVTIAFTSNEILGSNPIVKVGGLEAILKAVNVSGKTYEYTYPIPAGNDDKHFVPIEIAGVDQAGNRSVQMEENKLSVDTKEPTFNTISVTSDIEEYPGLAKVGSTVTVTFTASEALFSAPVVTIGGQPADNDSNGLNYVYKRILDGTETSGTANISISGRDMADNNGADASAFITTDFQAPSFTVSYFTDEALTQPLTNEYLKAGTYYIKVSSDEVLSSAPTISIEAEGSGNNVDNIETILSSVNNYKYTRIITNDAAAVGAIREAITIIGVDIAGNTNTPAPIDGKYTDTVNPTVSLSKNHDDFSKQQEIVVITANFSEPMASTPTISIDLIDTDMDIADVMSGSGTAWTYSWTIPAGHDGKAVITAAGADRAGNNYIIGTDKVELTIDNISPTKPEIVSPTANQIIRDSNGNVLVTFSTSDSNGKKCFYKIDNSENGEITGCSSPASITIPDGRHAITLFAVDIAGNKSEETTVDDVLMDKDGIFTVGVKEDFLTIQEALVAAVDGNTISIKNGHYDLTATLNLTKQLTIKGESREGVIIDASAVSGYGITNTSGVDNLTLEDFSLLGPTADVRSSYGIKAAYTDNLIIENVTVSGSGRSEVDLNTVNGANLYGVTVDGNGTKGVGIALSASANITLENIVTTGNAWGGIALYDTLSGTTSDVSFIGTTNTFDEENSIYIDAEYNHAVTNITLPADYDYAVRNTAFRSEGPARSDDFTFFQTTKEKAVAYALVLQAGLNKASYIQTLGDQAQATLENNFVVGKGMAIQSAINAAVAGGTVNVAGGTYNENILIEEKSINLLGEGKGITIIKGVDATPPAHAVILVKNTGSSNSPISIKGLTIDATFSSYGEGWGDGIYILNSNYVTVEQNNIINSQDAGILIGYGSDNNVVKKNTITGSPLDSNRVIDIFDSENNMIGGVDASDGNTLSSAMPGHSEDGHSPYLYGVNLSGPNSKNNTIQYNTITGGNRGVQVDDNIIGTVINNNTIYDTKGYAAVVINTGSIGAKINNNYVYDSLGGGFAINAQTAEFNNNRILNNGFGIEMGATGATFVLRNNSIAGNCVSGVCPDVGGIGGLSVYAGSADATENWWGNASGPGHSSNPGATGDAVSNNVTFRPWYTNPELTGLDPTGPTIAITTSVSSRTKASPIPFNVTFGTGEIVYDFTAADITVTNGMASEPVVSDNSYTFNVTPANQGAVTVSITANKVWDASGNYNTLSNTLSAVYDNVVPTLSFASISSSNTNHTLVKVGDTITLSFTAGEDLQAPTVTIAGQPATVTPAGDAKNWSAAYTMVGTEAEAVVVFNVSFTDLAGNPGAAVTAVVGNTSSVIFDKTAPAVSITSIGLDGFINNSEKGAIAIAGTAETGSLVKVTLSDGIHTVLGEQQLDMDETEFLILPNGLDLQDGVITPSVTATDAAGNVSQAATTPTAIKDIIAPTVLSHTPLMTAVNVETNIITIVFSEAMNVGVDQITLNPETTFTIGGSGTDTITLTTSPLNSNTVYTATVTTNVKDLAGNALVEAHPWSFTTATLYNIALNAGPSGAGAWNLISLPVVPNNKSISVVLGAAKAKTEAVWTYDPNNATAVNGWLVYVPDNPLGTNNLDIMTAGFGYWISVTSNTTISGSGSLLTVGPTAPPSRDLRAGWNLIGYYQIPGEIFGTKAAAFASLGSSYTSLWGFNNPTNNQGGGFKSSVDQILPGDAFWISLPSAKIYTPSNIIFN